MSRSSPSCLALIHPDMEELELVAPVDLMRRAGVEVTTASTGASLATGRNALTLQADCLLAEQVGKEFDLLFIPGGPGIKALVENEAILELVRTQAQSGRSNPAICAAPTVLKAAGILNGCPVTAHPSVWPDLENVQKSSPHVVSDKILTSQGAGTATSFGLVLVEHLCSTEVAAEVAQSICWPYALSSFSK